MSTPDPKEGRTAAPPVCGRIYAALGNGLPESWKEAFRSFFSRELWSDVRRSMAAWFRKNGLYALLAVTISCGIYYAVSEWAVEYERELSLEVTIQGEGSEGKIFGTTPSIVKTTFRGANDDLLMLDITKPKISIPARNLYAIASATNNAVVELRKSHVIGRGKLDIVKFDPETISISIDEKDTRTILLSPPVAEGVPYHGHVGKMQFASGESVEVTGMKSKLNSLGSLSTEPVSVANRAGIFTNHHVKVIIPPEYTWIEKCEPDQVSVAVAVEPDNKTLVYSNAEVRVAIHPGAVLPLRYKLIPAEVTMTITAWEKDVPLIHPEDLSVFANLESANIPKLSYDAPPFTSVVHRVQAVVPPELAIERVRIEPTNVIFIAYPPPRPPKPATIIATATNLLSHTIIPTNPPSTKATPPPAARPLP